MAEDERERRLRKKAEKSVGIELATLENVTPDQMRHLVHELQVRQIELQMQNEELRSAQDQLEESRTKYFELYDLAPVAYLTLDGDGGILEANLRAADLLGHARSRLLRRKFRDFVNVSQLDAFAEYLRAVAKTDGRRTCELELVRRDRSTVAVHLETIRINVEGKEGAWELRTIITDLTERKRAEARVGEAERFARKINESSLNGIYIYNIEKEEIVYINHECERLTGYTPGDLPIMKGETFFSLFLPEDRTRVREYIAQVSQAGDGETREIECRFKIADGRWIWCLSRNAVFERDKEGKARAIIGTFLDVTARKQAEEALGQAHGRAVWLARFPEENPNPVVRVSADGRVLYRNRAAAELPGWACEVGKPLPEPLLPIVVGGMAVGEDAQQDVQLGGRFYSVSVAPFPQESYVNVYGRDITKRKQAEEALRESEQRLNRAQEIAHLGSWELDLVKNRLTWSHEVYRIFGLEPQEFGATYEAFLEAVHPDDRAAVDAAYSGSLREGRDTYEIEHRVVCKASGEVRLVHERCQHLRDATGRIGRSVGMVHDITERKRAEQALRASEEALRQVNERLEEKVRERTAELRALNENLMETRDQLRSLASDLTLTEAREKRALASELHDTVAQMLAIAKLTLESTGACLEGKSAKEVKRVVQILQEASRQTRSLMADLSPSLLYEAGLGQALRALARRMKELHSLAIEVVDDGDPKPLGEDYRVLLFRAVQELLHNVVKHAKATNVKVSLQREGEQMRIEVEDDGVGFLVSQRGRGDGMREGFGLFSIQERLRHLGGSFEVFSEPGKGARAVLVVPLQVEGEGEGKEPATVKILIAEDHKIMRDALASLLEKEPGFEVVGLAADGLEAVRLAREVKPDVVLMDVNMPRMDGIEATRQIRAALPETKVIGLSVLAEPQIASQVLAAGANSFVAKSSSPEELTEAIRTAVGSTGGT